MLQEKPVKRVIVSKNKKLWEKTRQQKNKVQTVTDMN